MRISALVPAYKAAGTIVATVESILTQTRQADEVIVLLDGIADETPALLARFGPRVRIISQENQGIACARNRLANEASGELLAFLDADDVWHSNYLQRQHDQFHAQPDVVAGFTGHMRFQGDSPWWDPVVPAVSRSIAPVEFFTRYNTVTSDFGSMSYCCVRKAAIDQLGPEPFSNDLHAVEDSYLCYQLALLGPVAFLPEKLVAYRLMPDSLSQNRVRNLGRWTTAFERLASRYSEQPCRPLARAFTRFHASKRREYAKVLFGVGRHADGRRQLLRSLANCLQPASLAKSMALLLLSLLPLRWQPTWPSAVRIPATASDTPTTRRA